MIQVADSVASPPRIAALTVERMHALCRRLPPFPPLANQLIQLFSESDCDLYDAVALIRSDAVFSGELLRISNSAEFSNYEPFEDVAQAVMYLGFERVQSAIRRITYARLMKDSFRHPYVAEIHRNNLACAIICERLLKAFGDDERLEEICPYSLGLYLKIGGLVLLRAFPAEYPAFLCSRFETESSLLSREEERFGFTHVTISRYLVKHWEFPETFQSLVSNHAEARNLGTTLSLSDGAWISSQLAGALGYSYLKGLRKSTFDELRSLLPREGRTPAPQDADEWKAMIDQHLQDLSL